MEIEVSDAEWMDQSWKHGKGKTPVYFYDKEMPDGIKSKETGLAETKTVVFIKKFIPGDPTFNYDQPAREKDFDQFPQEFARYKAKATQQMTGTALKKWPKLSESQIQELHALNIYTLEQFLSVPDSAAHRIMGYSQLKKECAAFMDMSRDAMALTKQREETERRDKEIAELRAQIAELSARTEVKPKRKYTRRVKVA